MLSKHFHINLEGPRRTPVHHYLRGTTVLWKSACEFDFREECYFTYPTNFNAVIALDFSAFNTLSVTNSHRALSPFGVRSVFHVLSVIFPSGDPVARIPRRE
jgi:hypothetical protein